MGGYAIAAVFYNRYVKRVNTCVETGGHTDIEIELQGNRVADTEIELQGNRVGDTEEKTSTEQSNPSNVSIVFVVEKEDSIYAKVVDKGDSIHAEEVDNQDSIHAEEVDKEDSIYAEVMDKGENKRAVEATEPTENLASSDPFGVRLLANREFALYLTLMMSSFLSMSVSNTFLAPIARENGINPTQVNVVNIARKN